MSNAANRFTGKTLGDSVDLLLSLKDRATARAIDAGTCRTRHDFNKAIEAEDDLANARDEFAATFDVEQFAKVVR